MVLFLACRKCDDNLASARGIHKWQQPKGFLFHLLQKAFLVIYIIIVILGFGFILAVIVTRFSLLSSPDNAFSGVLSQLSSGLSFEI